MKFIYSAKFTRNAVARISVKILSVLSRDFSVAIGLNIPLDSSDKAYCV
jgi:hypothetical protein